MTSYKNWIKVSLVVILLAISCWGQVAAESGYTVPRSGFGLSLILGPGTCSTAAGTIVSYIGTIINLAQNKTNYGYLTSSCVVTTNTTGFPSSSIPIFIAITGVSEITSLTDSRTTYNFAGGGGGLPAGSNTQVQFNDGGVFGGNPGFTFDKTTGNVVTQGPTPGTDFQIIIAGQSAGGLGPVTIHSPFANGIDLFTHANLLFRAPFINFNRSRGTQAAPTTLTYTGFESTALGGFNWNGYDGTTYANSSGLFVFTDEAFAATGTHHGSHIEIYGTNVGSPNEQELFQFGGYDSTGAGVNGNNISFRNLCFSGNLVSNPCLKPIGAAGIRAAIMAIRTGDDSADAAITGLSLQLQGGSTPNDSIAGFLSLGTITVGALPVAAAGNVGQMIKVSDSTAVAAEGQTCIGGSTNTALAFSNGVVWKCF